MRTSRGEASGDDPPAMSEADPALLLHARRGRALCAGHGEREARPRSRSSAGRGRPRQSSKSVQRGPTVPGPARRSPSSDSNSGADSGRIGAPPSAPLQKRRRAPTTAPRGCRDAPKPARLGFSKRDEDGISRADAAGCCSDVEVAHAEREIDRVDIFERGRQKRQVRRERNDRDEADERRAHESDGAQAQRVVQAAEAVAAQIDASRAGSRARAARDRSASATSGSSARGPSRRGRSRAAPSVVAMMADAADAEAELAQDGLGLLDHPQLLVGDLAEVRNARRQARRRGLVPGRQAGAARQLADLVLGQARPRRAGCARRTRAPPAGRDDSRRDRRRCCRRRSRRCRARAPSRTGACRARACSSSSGSRDWRDTRAAPFRRCG